MLNLEMQFTAYGLLEEGRLHRSTKEICLRENKHEEKKAEKL